MIVIRGGSVYTPEGWLGVDVVVEGSEITAVASGIGRGGDEIDATGCLVGPAFVDLHTHLREPGQTWKEDIESGSRAAAAGGYGGVVAMPNTDPPADSPKVVETVHARGNEIGLVEVIPAGTLTAGRSGAAPSDIPALYDAGVRIFTDDGDTVSDSNVMEEIMGAVAAFPDAVVAQHAEDPILSAGGQMNEGTVSARLGVDGIPDEAESSIVARDIALAAKTGARYHCQHVSSRRTLETVAEVRGRGVRVTLEVTPHHLTFDDTHLESLDTNFKMYPPLRSPDDRLALIDGLRRGIIDVVATDHAPHTEDEKDVAFEDAPRGVIGLETAAAAVWEVLGERDRFFEVMSLRPAAIAATSRHGNPVVVGGPANLVIFDPAHRWTVETFQSRSSNSPYLGREMIGKVRATIHEGELTHHRGEGR